MAEMRDGKDGFNNGIMAGAGGMVKGGTGLAQHAVGGGAGSMSRMTKALNKPLTYLTFDTEYIHKKEIRDLKEKPKDLFEGVSAGTVALVRSVASGIAGIVVQPYRGAQNNGVAGFVKGIATGTLGVVTKPTSGVVDLITKLGEGLEN